MGRAVCLLLALCLGGVAARCVRDGWDRLGRAPLTNALNISRRALTAESEQELLQFLSGEYETQASDLCNAVNIAEWNFNTDLGNPANEEAYNTATLALAEFEKKQWEAHFKDVSIETVQDASLKRQLKYLQSLGTSALSKDRLELLNKYLLQMQNIYSTAKICPYDKKDCDLKTEGLNLDPGIEEVITTSRDYDVLTHLWTAWHDASGKLMRGDYKEYVTLSNEAATANNFEDMGKMWQASYEVDDFMTTIDSLWSEVKPLYQELHTYTLNRLRKVYGENIPKDKNLIPGHLLGNMWGQTWINLYDLLVPYPEASSYDVTASLVDQKYDAKKMFETADDFYKSMGLKPNDMCYGDKAMITKPADREVTCHASAWDFCDKKDFRIKMCTKINQDDFRTIHHEMGHIQYYQQYAPLPYVLRTGANPGFHEAIGDTIALSVDTPKHLKKVGLLVDSDFTDTKESRVNALMKMALEKVAFLPFGLLVDKWRWEVFAGLSEDRWNARWWELKNEYQMLSSPVPRSEADFDPGAKYHVPADSKYISYFVAHILEFQFYKALCIEAKQYDPTDPNGEPLHTCDFYQSKEAGKKLAEGLEKGASVHWKETLQVMTGETEMTGQALMEYFKPLYEFLKEANRDGGITTSAPTTPATTAAPTTPATIAAPTTPATSAAPTTPAATSEAPTTPAIPAAPTTPVPSPKPGSAVTFAPVTIITILIPLCLLHFTDSWLSY